ADGGTADVFHPPAVALEDDRVGDGAGLETTEITRDVQAAHVTGTDGRIPARLDLAGVLAGGDAVVDDDGGSGLAGDRTIQVLERRTLVRRTATVILGPTGLDRREADRLGILELQALDPVFGTHAEPGKQQVGQRTRI